MTTKMKVPVESTHRLAEELVEALIDNGPMTKQQACKLLAWSEGRWATALAYARNELCPAMGMAIPSPTPTDGWRYQVTCDWLPVRAGASYSMGVIESRLRGVHRDVKIVLPHIDKDEDLLAWRQANFLNKHLEHLLRTLAEINGSRRTRGKHAASAAKRRAESAEEQLDRLLPQLVDAKRTAHRYRAEAERVPVLLRELKELKDKVGIPLDQHEGLLRQVEQERDVILETYDEAVALILERMTKCFVEPYIASLNGEERDVKHINDELLMALYVLPEWVYMPMLTAAGWERRMRKGAVSPWGADRLRESEFGRKSRYGGRKLTEVHGELGERMVKFLSARADEREARRATAPDES